MSRKQAAYLYVSISPFQWSGPNKNTELCLFFSNAVEEWNKLRSQIRNAEAYPSFRKILLNFIRPTQKHTCKIYDLLGTKLLTRLWFGFNHLSENKFRHKFEDLLTYLLVFLLVFFFYQSFLSRTMKTHRTAGEGRGSSFIPFYHFHQLTNIQTFVCSFAREMTITYYKS